MAEHTPWTARPIANYGWVVEEEGTAEPICIELLEEHALQIVHKHNLHPRLVDALKLSLDTHIGARNEAFAAASRCGRAFMWKQQTKWEDLVIRYDKMANAIREVIAEAEKEGQDGHATVL